MNLSTLKAALDYFDSVGLNEASGARITVENTVLSAESAGVLGAHIGTVYVVTATPPGTEVLVYKGQWISSNILARVPLHYCKPRDT